MAAAASQHRLQHLVGAPDKFVDERALTWASISVAQVSEESQKPEKQQQVKFP